MTMSLSFVKKPIKDSKGTKISFLVWIISIFLFVILSAIYNRSGKSITDLGTVLSTLFFGNILIGVIAFIFTIFFVTKQSLITTKNKSKNTGFNPWIVSTVLLLILISFLIGKSTTDKNQKSLPLQQVIKTEPSKNNYQQVIIQPTSTTTAIPAQTKVPVSFSNGSTYNCDQNAVQALRDADSSYQKAEQEKSQCSKEYAQKDINRLSSCKDSCYSFYDYQTQADQRKQCVDQCYSDYKKFVSISSNTCNTYSSSQKSNLDFLINKYCR
jgi:hypothetical protein